MSSRAESYETLQGIHFWVSEAPSGLRDWHPDAEPSRFATGFGHSVLELFVRLQLSGASVSIGPQPPSETRAIVVFAKSVIGLRTGTRFLFAARRLPVMLIRSDFGSDWPLQAVPDVEVMPNRSCITRPYQTWIPPLPQRGLVARSPERKGRVASVGYKGNASNLPEFARSAAWSASLRAEGLRWLPDVPRRDGSSDHTWHDYSGTDVTLCLRSNQARGIANQKPATKLINSWRADCIPIVPSEPAYLELVRDGKDGLVCDDEDAVLQALARLRANPRLVREMEFNIEERAQEFAPQRVLHAWAESLQTLSCQHVSEANSHRRFVAGLWLAARAAPRLVRWRSRSRSAASEANDGWLSRPSS